MTDHLFVRLAISLGIGLLIGAERERRKGSGPKRGAAGIRTFALASLAGGISIAAGGGVLLAVTALGVAGLSVSAYTRSRQDDPGLTSELALLTTTLLGALSVREPSVAAGFAVIVASLLAGRDWMPLTLSGMTAGVYGAIFMGRSLQQHEPGAAQPGRAFSVWAALAFAATVSAILFASAALGQWLGGAGLMAAAGMAGFADAHAVAISAASLVAAGKISVEDSVPLVLIGFTTNTISKIVIAATAGGRQFARRVIPGLILVLIAAWLGSM